MSEQHELSTNTQQNVHTHAHIHICSYTYMHKYKQFEKSQFFHHRIGKYMCLKLNTAYNHETGDYQYDSRAKKVGEIEKFDQIFERRNKFHH